MEIKQGKFRCWEGAEPTGWFCSADPPTPPPRSRDFLRQEVQPQKSRKESRGAPQDDYWLRRSQSALLGPQEEEEEQGARTKRRRRSEGEERVERGKGGARRRNCCPRKTRLFLNICQSYFYAAGHIPPSPPPAPDP